jgi:hypothetical protein
MFQFVFNQPASSGVTELQGVGWGHSGYVIHFRFHAAPNRIQELLARDNWRPVDWETAKREFELNGKGDSGKFRPLWAPEQVEPKKLYYRGSSSGPRHGNATDYMLIDEIHGTVYVAGSGL